MNVFASISGIMITISILIMVTNLEILKVMMMIMLNNDYDDMIIQIKMIKMMNTMIMIISNYKPFNSKTRSR